MVPAPTYIVTHRWPRLVSVLNLWTDAVPSNESNNHHFVPRSVLRRFSPDEDRTYVFVFDKVSGRSWPGGMATTGSGKGYNTLTQADGERLNFEPDFDEIDATYARIGDHLAATRDVSKLSDTMRGELADVVAVQLLRTPIVRSTLEKLPRDLVEEMQRVGLPAPDDTELPSDDQVRQASRDLVANRAPTRETLLAKDLMLFEPQEQARFWTSDHPVARYSTTPLGETGLQSLGVEIFLPIAADLLVGLACPSLRRGRVSWVDETGPQSSAQAEVIARGLPLKIDERVVGFFNYLQVRSSQRFLYAMEDDFELARQTLALMPSLRSNDSLITMGQMGRAPPRPANLPPGEWLVLESTIGHRLIPILGYTAVGLGHEMSTYDLGLLDDAVRAQPFVRANIFAKTGGGGMRGVKIKVLDRQPPARFKLVHADPSLEGLDAMIAQRRSEP